jgi:hypothetical protein
LVHRIWHLTTYKQDSLVFNVCEAQKLANFAPEKEISFQIALRKQIYPNFSQKKNLSGFHNGVELGRYFLSK